MLKHSEVDQERIRLGHTTKCRKQWAAQTPQVAEFPSFLTAEEAAALIRAGRAEGLQPEDALAPRVRDVNKVPRPGRFWYAMRAF